MPTLSAHLTANLAPGRPVPNRLVVLTISGIRALDGSELQEDVEVQFVTILDPQYSNIMKVRMIAGEFLQDVPDDALDILINWFSRQADVLNYRPIIATLDPARYDSYKDQWVAGSVVLTLLSGTAANAAMSKRLGDLSVTRSRGAEELLDNLKDKLDDLEDYLQAGGNYAMEAEIAIRGDLTPDHPVIGRLWAEPDRFDMPAFMHGSTHRKVFTDRATGLPQRRPKWYFGANR